MPDAIVKRVVAHAEANSEPVPSRFVFDENKQKVQVMSFGSSICTLAHDSSPVKITKYVIRRMCV